jgi:hypothetical protein
MRRKSESQLMWMWQIARGLPLPIQRYLQPLTPVRALHWGKETHIGLPEAPRESKQCAHQIKRGQKAEYQSGNLLLRAASDDHGHGTHEHHRRNRRDPEHLPRLTFRAAPPTEFSKPPEKKKMSRNGHSQARDRLVLAHGHTAAEPFEQLSRARLWLAPTPKPRNAGFILQPGPHGPPLPPPLPDVSIEGDFIAVLLGVKLPPITQAGQGPGREISRKGYSPVFRLGTRSKSPVRGQLESRRRAKQSPAAATGR